MAQSPARLLWICLPLAFPATLGAQFTVQLAPRTDRQFIEYQQAAETKMDWQAHLSPAPGDVLIAAGAEAAVTGVPGGMIHDWRAATIVPGATVAQALAVLQDYANYKRIYAPEIADSKLLSHEGNTYRAYLRLIQKKILTVILDSEYEVEYRPLGNGRESPNRWAILSRSTRFAEVSNGQELPPGTGHGFLWHLNSYWLIEPRGGGVYLECRSISLSRDIPVVFEWIIKPMVTSVPRESLRGLMNATAHALTDHHAPVSREEPSTR